MLYTTTKFTTLAAVCLTIFSTTLLPVATALATPPDPVAPRVVYKTTVSLEAMDGSGATGLMLYERFEDGSGLATLRVAGLPAGVYKVSIAGESIAAIKISDRNEYKFTIKTAKSIAVRDGTTVSVGGILHGVAR